MKNLYVTDLSPGTVLNGQVFAVFEVKKTVDRNNNPYIDLILSDKTGRIKAKVWHDNIPNVENKSLKVGKVVAIDAVVEEYKGALQLNLQRAVSVSDAQMDDYVQSSQFDSEQMMAELQQVINEKIKDTTIKQLMDNILSDSELARKIKYWPAATSFHHEFRSGLLQHILECLALAEGLDKYYPDLNFDLVRAGIILHDLGKTEEIDASAFAPKYTAAGSVLGHIYLGTQILDKYYPENGDETVKMHLKHIILSHHGQKEKGSPVLPATAESLLVAGIDDTSAKTRMGADALQAPVSETGMTDYNRYLQRWMWADNKPKTSEEDAIIYPEE